MTTTAPDETSDTAANPPDVASDGSPAALQTPLFGGLQIGWDTVLRTLPIYLGLVLIWLYFNYRTGGLFIGARNLSEMAQEYSYEAVLAIGVVFVLLLGEIDLSLGYLTLLSVALTSTLSALQGWPAWAAIAAAILICALVG